jgi:hypothetical protein
MRTTTDDRIAELYSLPPEEFVAARDELVRQLRASDDKEDADRVRGLRRPSPALWAVNQLALSEPGAFAALLQAAEGLRSAQGRLLAGEAQVQLSRSAQAHRDAVAELSEAGRRLLEAQGRPASPAMVERIRRTLYSASLLEEARGLLAEGRLTGEVPVTGFGFDVESEEPAEPRRRRADSSAEMERKRRERAETRRTAERALEDAERRRETAQQRLRETRSALERTEIEHASAERALAAAQDTTTRAREALAAATHGEERAVSAAGAAASRAQRAREEETEALAAVERAQFEVESARTHLRSLPSGT